MPIIEWLTNIDNSTKNIQIPDEIMQQADKEAIKIKTGNTLTTQIVKYKTGEQLLLHLTIEKDNQLVIPEHVKDLLKNAGKIRLTILGSKKGI